VFVVFIQHCIVIALAAHCCACYLLLPAWLYCFMLMIDVLFCLLIVVILFVFFGNANAKHFQLGNAWHKAGSVKLPQRRINVRIV